MPIRILLLRLCLIPEESGNLKDSFFLDFLIWSSSAVPRNLLK